MAGTQSQQFTLLKEEFYDDPEQLSQLLRQRAGSGSHFAFTASTADESRPSISALAPAESSQHRAPPQQPPVAFAPLAHPPPPRRAPSKARYARPGLQTHQSAPASTGVVSDQEGGDRMYQSFDADVMGDTQPDSQIYKNWTSRAHETHGIRGNGGNNATSLLDPVAEHHADTTTDGVEMARSNPEEQQSYTITSPIVTHDDDRDTQMRANAPLTSPLKFETPAMAGRKRDSQGEVLSSAMQTATTPGSALATAPLFHDHTANGVGNPMSLTQIFNATQAATSPLVGAPSEDAVFQRPSPNFTNARHSSPVLAMSSPIKPARIGPPLRFSSEPRAEYVTMKQSQERRSREVDGEEAAPSSQDSWDELAAVEKQRAKRKARAEFESAAEKKFRTVTAPAPSPRLQRRKGNKLVPLSVTSKLKAPKSLRAARRSAYDGPFDDDEESANEVDESPESTSLNENKEDGDDDVLSPDELSQGALSPDALSQGVHSSARPTPLKAASKTVNKVQVPNTSSHPQRTLSGRAVRNSPSGSPSAQLHRESQPQASGSQPLERRSQLKSSRESVAVMDSQPDTTYYDSISRPKSLIIPSSSSTNQYSINQTTLSRAGVTSQLVSSSIPPMPPKSSPAITRHATEDDEQLRDDEEVVPSSPPPVDVEAVEDDDITYDEHDYDEHHSARGDDERGGRHSVGGDVDMDGDESVPESEQGDEEDEDEDEEEDGMEVTAPLKVDNGKRDHEIPETTEKEELFEIHAGEDGLIHSNQPNDEQDSTVHKAPGRPQLQRQSTIPESDNMDDTQTNDGDFQTAESGANDSATLKQTCGTEPFHTAQEQQSTSPSNKDNCNEKSNSGEVTTMEQGPRFRSLNDIANQPQTQNSIDIADIDIPQFSFTNNIDDEFDMMKSRSSPNRPASKKRKITYSAKKHVISPLKNSSREVNRLASPPLRKDQEVLDDGQSSTAGREERGALAAAHAREEVLLAKLPTLKSGPLAKAKSARTRKQGALKSVNKRLLQRSPLKVKTAHSSKTIEGHLSSSSDTEDSDVEMRDVEAQFDEPDELAGPSPQPAEPTTRVEPAHDRGEAPTGDILVPNRVFAAWPRAGYYPATCLGHADSHRLHVRYDDGSNHTLESVLVRMLDLRIGDHVKVDEIGMKKHIYVVVGLQDKINADHDDEYPLTDLRGYKTVVLEVKQPDSLPAARLEGRQQPISVPVESIYLTAQLWNKYHDRLYKLSPRSSPLATPIDQATHPATPSLSKRGTTRPSLLRESVRAGSVSSSVRGGSGTVFMNMAFAITLTQDDDGRMEKHTLTSLINSHSGGLLDDGFHELFDSVDTSGAVKSPTKPSSKTKGKIASSTPESLVLKEEYKNLRFTALITDSHSRRTKYMQALALNIPCLHYRWLTDSIAASSPLPFGKYLLPAGLSKYLDPYGVVRSRNMELYDPNSEGANVEAVVKGRNMLLRNQSVLLVMGKSKEEVERKKPYLFITHALGPKAVGRCTDIATAKDAINDGDWDWVYVDGELTPFAKAERTLFDNAQSTKSKKRKREQSAERVPWFRVGDVGGKKIRLVCNEFVIQSLILGALLEE